RNDPALLPRPRFRRGPGGELPCLPQRSRVDRGSRRLGKGRQDPRRERRRLDPPAPDGLLSNAVGLTLPSHPIMSTPKLVALAGSARRASLNRAVLATAVEAAGEAGATVTPIDLND